MYRKQNHIYVLMFMKLISKWIQFNYVYYLLVITLKMIVLYNQYFILLRACIAFIIIPMHLFKIEFIEIKHKNKF